MNNVQCSRCKREYKPFYEDSDSANGCDASFRVSVTAQEIKLSPDGSVTLHCGYGSRWDMTEYKLCDELAEIVICIDTMKNLELKVTIPGQICDLCISKMLSSGKLKEI